MTQAILNFDSAPVVFQMLLGVPMFVCAWGLSVHFLCHGLARRKRWSVWNVMSAAWMLGIGVFGLYEVATIFLHSPRLLLVGFAVTFAIGFALFFIGLSELVDYWNDTQGDE